MSGVLAGEAGEFNISAPLNLEPVFVDSKISKGQLRIAAGALQIGTGPGIDRGGISWNSQCYRVMGTKLVQVAANGTVTTLGDVGGDGYVALDYSFDRLAIASGNGLWYWDGLALNQNVDEDLGAVIDMIWVDGYFMTTDGTYVVVTELSDPYQVLPLKYGSAEEDPDMITGLLKVREEVYALGRHTIQVYQNIGGNGFPFSTIKGATIPRGCVAASAKCLYGESFAFVGSGRNEALGVHVAGQGQSDKISDRRVDDALAAVSDPTTIRVEARTARDELRLYVHLPTETWVFLATASSKAGEKVWYRVQSGVGQPYRIRNAVHCYGKVLVGDTGSEAIGEWTDTVATHFGEPAQWRFDVGMLYNQGTPTTLHKVDLVGLPGRGDTSMGGAITMSITQDGETFSPERTILIDGARSKRMQWRPHARIRNYIGLRFRGLNKMLPGFAACEVNGA
jgi:hypothetical protein